MKISEHFELDEFLFSETASRLGKIPIIPTPEQMVNCERLARVLLEPVRARLGRAMYVLSGIRPIWLNEMVGGAPKSAHLEGRAADIRVSGMVPAAFFGFLRRQPDLPFDQVILEFDSWVHVAIAPGAAKPRNEFLIARKSHGKTHYEVAP